MKMKDWQDGVQRLEKEIWTRGPLWCGIRPVVGSLVVYCSQICVLGSCISTFPDILISCFVSGLHPGPQHPVCFGT
ncbi:Hypothetical predicted protein [Podarcis lilfordi]|uniref:Uncharacterized protein n=1 Tax=Podarcis lilfordi TaxID=74358 RepID=A0AA35PRK6_9SAUR|nr:Hypothetical predicted protein [Podarcis lilfordi]